MSESLSELVKRLEESSSELAEELKNFEHIAVHLMPLSGEIPKLEGIDVYGEVIPLTGMIGGDHITYVDFKQRYNLDAMISERRNAGQRDIARMLEVNKRRAGILIADASGHRITDAAMCAMLHQAFLVGAGYELKMHGEITPELFHDISNRFYHSSAVDKFITMLYGEISESGTFKFISAAHPVPVVFSNLYDKIVDIDPKKMSGFPPLGTWLSEGNSGYVNVGNKKVDTGGNSVNKIELIGSGDILILYTDGLSEHKNGEEPYFPGRLESVIRAAKHLSAKEISDSIKRDIFRFAKPTDDISYVIIKKE